MCVPDFYFGTETLVTHKWFSYLVGVMFRDGEWMSLTVSSGVTDISLIRVERCLKTARLLRCGSHVV